MHNGTSKETRTHGERRGCRWLWQCQYKHRCRYRIYTGGRFWVDIRLYIELDRTPFDVFREREVRRR
jgi:hypothetical protein